jgi:imidazolonepropionase-like amidohydrolase
VIGMSMLVTGGTLIDGTGTDPRDADVVIDDGRFGAIGAVQAQADESVEVDGLTVLPGLIDLHTHMGLVAMAAEEAMAPAVTAAHLFRNAELCLLSGHTTAREVAGADGGLRQAIDAGLIPGPRLFPSGPILCQSGGHGDMLPPFFAHHHTHRPGVPGLSQAALVCDGPDEVRIAARTAFRRGATQIKVCTSGGVVSLTDSMDDTQFTVEELRAAVIEAQARGTYVTAHAHNVRAILNGLDAGLECFEHGTFLDEATAARMAAAGAALVPTMTVLHQMREKWREWFVPEEVMPRLDGVADAMAESIKLASAAGVLIGSGTDILGSGQDGRGQEIALKAAILGPMAAIVSATSDSAKILRRADLGVVREGATGDLIAVDFDPLAEPALWTNPDRVVLVIKGGQVVKDRR